MTMLLDFPTIGEPHYAQAIPADMITKNSLKFYDLAANHHPWAIHSEAETGVERKGHDVHIRMSQIRTHFKPDNIEGVKLGDTVYFHVTNLEQDWDVPHGFGIEGNQNSELLIMPGQTRTIAWTPTREGVFPFYCTDFCSALHQEMSGLIRVSGKSSNVQLSSNK
jgi:nitrous-oxide reductase